MAVEAQVQVTALVEAQVRVAALAETLAATLALQPVQATAVLRCLPVWMTPSSLMTKGSCPQ